MKRQTPAFILALAAAAMPCLVAGEAPPPRPPAPQPGLEIFDDATQIRQGSRYGNAPAEQPEEGAPQTPQPPLPDQVGAPQTETDAPAAPAPRSREGAREDYLSDPGLTRPRAQPPYAAPDAGRYSPAPAPRPEPEPEAPMSAYDDPFSDFEEDPGYDQGYEGVYEEPGDQMDQSFAEPAPPAEPYVPQIDPVTSMLNHVNVAAVRNFPGIDAAAMQGDVQGLGNIILGTLRQRRVIDATMERGIRASVGVSSPYDFQRLADAVNQVPVPGEDPLAPARRVNVILDALDQPMIDDAVFPGVMPSLLIRLSGDIQAVRFAMAQTGQDEGALLELSRTYVRAAATCDYFAFPARELALDVNSIMRRGAALFNPDGSSRIGDTGGITGNLFQILLMMDHYSRNDGGFRRSLGAMWNALEKPGRFLLDIARPDKSLPFFGARGTKELLPVEMDAIDAMLPAPPLRTRTQRIGLAASNSFPPASDVQTFGGLFVERDTRDPMGRYLAVRFGSRSDVPGVPAHSDFGALELMSRGGRYLVDAGGYGGESAAAAAHGGLSINGQYAPDTTYPPAGVPSEAVWRTNASIDYALGQAGFADTKTWQRGVLYVKNLPGETRTDYWVVLDHVDMRGDPEPRNIAVRYQVAPGVIPHHDGPGVFLAGGMTGTGVRMYAVDAGVRMDVTDGMFSTGLPGAIGDIGRGHVFDATGGALPAPSVVLTRQLAGDATTSTIIYPADDMNHRPVRIERDSDIIRGRTGALVIDHGMGRMDVVAWAPPGAELVTPTLNLQLAADLAVFRIRRGKIARVDFVNLERFQAKEPDGGLWSMRVDGPAQSLTIEPEQGGGWQVLADPANRGAATIFDVNLGPAVARSRFSIRPGEMRVIYR